MRLRDAQKIVDCGGAEKSGKVDILRILDPDSFQSAAAEAAAPVCTHPAAAGQVYKFRPENLVLVRRMCFPRVFLH